MTSGSMVMGVVLALTVTCAATFAACAWPATSPVSLVLREDWAIGGADDESVYGLIVDCARGADGRTYVLDRQLAEVQVIDSRGRVAGSFGGVGEGPGEFSQPVDVAVLADGRIAVLQSMPARLSVFADSDLHYQGELDVPERPRASTMVIGMGAMAHGVVLQELTTVQSADGMSQWQTVACYSGGDGSGSRQVLASAQRTFGGVRIVVREAETKPTQWAVAGGRVGLNVSWRGGVSVVAIPGGSLFSVKPPDPSRDRSSSQRAQVEAFIRGGGGAAGAEIDVEPTDRDIQWLGFGPDDALWLLTSQGAAVSGPGVIGRFAVFDAGGGFAGEVLLRGKGRPAWDKLVSERGYLYVLTNFGSAFASWRVGLSQGAVAEIDPDGAAEDEQMGVVCYRLPTVAELRAAAE